MREKKLAEIKKLGEETDIFIDGGWWGATLDTDYIEHCEGCGKVLDCAPIEIEYLLLDENGIYQEGPPSEIDVAMLALGNNFPTDQRIRKEAYRLYWDSLNAKRGYGWDINPWVWVIEFKRAEE